MQATQMNSNVAGQQTERVLLARLVNLLSGTASTSEMAAGASGLVGNVGGFTSSVKFTQATSNNTYASGNAVGGLITFTGAVRTPGTGIIESLTLWDLDHQAAALDLLILDSAPGVAVTDHASWALASPDQLKIIGRIAIAGTDWVTYNNVGLATERGLGIAVKAAAGMQLFGVLLCNGSAPVYTGVGRVGGVLGILED